MGTLKGQSKRRGEDMPSETSQKKRRVVPAGPDRWTWCRYPGTSNYIRTIVEKGKLWKDCLEEIHAIFHAEGGIGNIPQDKIKYRYENAKYNKLSSAPSVPKTKVQAHYYLGGDCDEDEGREEDGGATHLRNCVGESPRPARETVFRTYRTLKPSGSATVRSHTPSPRAPKPAVSAVGAFTHLEPGECLDFSAFQVGCAAIDHQCQHLLTSLEEARQEIVRLEKENADLRNKMCRIAFDLIPTAVSEDLSSAKDNSFGGMPTASAANIGRFGKFSSTILPTTPPPIAVPSSVDTPSPAASPNISVITPPVVLHTTGQAHVTSVQAVNGNDDAPNTTPNNGPTTPPFPSETTPTGTASYEVAASTISSRSPTIEPAPITSPELGTEAYPETTGESAATEHIGIKEASTIGTFMGAPPPCKFSDIIKDSEEEEEEIAHFGLDRKTNGSETLQGSPRAFNMFAKLFDLARLG